MTTDKSQRNEKLSPPNFLNKSKVESVKPSPDSDIAKIAKELEVSAGRLGRRDTKDSIRRDGLLADKVLSAVGERNIQEGENQGYLNKLYLKRLNEKRNKTVPKTVEADRIDKPESADDSSKDEKLTSAPIVPEVVSEVANASAEDITEPLEDIIIPAATSSIKIDSGMPALPIDEASANDDFKVDSVEESRELNTPNDTVRIDKTSINTDQPEPEPIVETPLPKAEIGETEAIKQPVIEPEVANEVATVVDEVPVEEINPAAEMAPVTAPAVASVAEDEQKFNPEKINEEIRNALKRAPKKPEMSYFDNISKLSALRATNNKTAEQELAA